MPENSAVAATPPKSILGGSTFTQRRDEILKKLKNCVEQCKENYSERKELANDKDEIIADLCDCLDEAFSYGLRQNEGFVLTASNLFQNMQEIVTGSSGATTVFNETTFWDFCQNHLTPHERERFENLKNVWTKCGRGRAFLRATLNENSLQRYVLTWLSDRELLQRHYTPWSLLLDEETSKLLPDLLGSLNNILFALTVDSLDHNKALRIYQTTQTKEEPIIYAPTPTPIANVNSKRKINPIERPIATINSKEDLLNNLTLKIATNEQTNASTNPYTESNGTTESPAVLVQPSNDAPFDPIEPELEFLNEPLPDLHPENEPVLNVVNNEESPKAEQDFEDKSDSSSQYSKASSTQDSANCAVLEEKLRDLTERYAKLETRAAQLSLENHQLLRRLTRHFHESGIDPKSSFATNFLITIPTVKLIQPKGATSSSYYAYDVHITMRQNLEHWSVQRRYRDFYKLHRTLLRTHPFIANVEFPPKKHFGNKNLIFVEERRQQLQIYLLNLVESLPQVEACKTKAELQRAFPFLRER